MSLICASIRVADLLELCFPKPALDGSIQFELNKAVPHTLLMWDQRLFAVETAVFHPEARVFDTWQAYLQRMAGSQPGERPLSHRLTAVLNTVTSRQLQRNAFVTIPNITEHELHVYGELVKLLQQRTSFDLDELPGLPVSRIMPLY